MLVFRRLFSTTTISLALRTRKKLDVSLQNNRVVFDEKKFLEKKKKEQKDFNSTPVQEASARKLVEEIIGREFDEKTSIGPQTLFTDSELDKIFSQKILRLKYKVLGTSGNQIQDSLLVDQDVRKFLERDDLARAKMLAKLARFQGDFAHGTIMEYLLRKGQVNSAFHLFQEFKKRGFKPKGRLYNILYSGYADAISQKLVSDVSSLKIEQLFIMFQREHEKGNLEMSIKHVNSLLKVFRKSKRPDLSIKLYESLNTARQGKNKLRPDVRTYTEILRSLAIEETLNFNEIIEKAERIFYNAQHNFHISIDSYLVKAYATIFAYSDDLELRARTTTILREWFRICKVDEIKEHIDIHRHSENLWKPNGRKVLDRTQNFYLLNWNEINSKNTKRFEPDESVLRMYREASKLFMLKCDYKCKEGTENRLESNEVTRKKLANKSQRGRTMLHNTKSIINDKRTA